MIYISYYTKNTPYKKVIEKYLHKSLHKWDLPHDIEEVEDRGTWQKNTHYKAEFIKKMLLKHKQAIVFLDADATIERNPGLFKKLSKIDIAYHSLDWELQWRRKHGIKKEILSGTLYLNYNEKVFKFLDEWIAENKINIQWEQKNMQNVLKKFEGYLRYYELPYEYIVIILHDESIPKHMVKEEDVVILHHQVSRKLRR